MSAAYLQGTLSNKCKQLIMNQIAQLDILTEKSRWAVSIPSIRVQGDFPTRGWLLNTTIKHPSNWSTLRKQCVRVYICEGEPESTWKSFSQLPRF